jgi:hypothetical protein
VVERSGQTVVVAQGPAYGYVQRPVAVQGHPFYQRTYYNGGSTYTRIYRPYTYHGVVMPVYYPVVYYTPAFYLWATNPWKRPVRYRAWASDSWLYESYFAPDPDYTSPLLWLADYLITCFIQPRDKSLALQNLQFWLQRLAAGETAVVANGQTTVTPDVKRLIADEVRWELNREQAEASHAGSQIRSAEGPPPILAGGQTHVFVVQDALTADAGGRACTLTEGDVLQLAGTPPENAAAASLQVLASKPPDCPIGATVSVKLSDLQEMQNHMHETIDQGLAELQAHHNGLPKPPAAAKNASVQAFFAADLPPADPNVAGEISEVKHRADQMEQDALNEALNDHDVMASGSSTGSPPTVTAGLTPDQVVAILGQPTTVFDLGQKMIYMYEKAKITFLNGKVSDVE